ncbi:unnamed protein product, partial [Ilex paraguariensis]
MQTSSLHSLSLPPRPFSVHFPHRIVGLGQRKRAFNSVTALQRDEYSKDHNYGRLVDSSMIVLRQRIHEMKMLEKNYASPPLCGWMEWEKRYYRDYHEDVFGAIRFLQSLLMETRPSLALAMVTLVLLSMFSSIAAVGFYVIDIGLGILAGIHLTS